jgi:carbon starvation protein
MVVMTGWAMVVNIRTYLDTKNWLLLVIGLIVFVLEIWVIIESVIVLRKVKSKSENI